MRKFGASLLALAAMTPFCLAVETKSWVQNEQPDFEKGTLKGLSLRSDGRLILAPRFQELLDSSTPYLWALAEDSKGNLYAGGGGPSSSTAKLYRIDPSGKSSTYADVPGMEIHAIAVDKSDRVYAATVPDGKVYRIENGKAQIFYDPKAKYIWAIAFDSAGNLFVATGDQGEIHRVTPNGQGSVFFKTEETHARSLAIDSKNNLIAGTEPGGLILRIAPNGDGFVLYQAAKKEITAVAAARDGSIYAAAVGSKPVSASMPSQTLSIPIPAATIGASAGRAPTGSTVATASITTQPSIPSSPIVGGSDVYRIEPDGYARRVWTHASDLVYTIAFDPAARPVLGTGNKGHIYRLDNDHLSTLLVNGQPTQITALLAGVRGTLYAATGNIGKVYQVGPDLEKQGTYESEPLDASFFSYWGRIHFHGSGAAFETRSGNLDRPQKNWNAWAKATPQVVSPAARFLQYRATLAGENASLSEVEIAYLQKNVPPQFEEIEITPANYKFSAPTAGLTITPSITLQPLGQKKKLPSISLDTLSSSQTLPYSKGAAGARWAASDPNSDELIFKVEIRGAKETEWKLLRDKVKERYISWDSTAFPDGEYVLRVMASDSPSNPPAQALTATIESEPFVIDNTPPQVMNLAGTRNGNAITVRWHAKDAISIVDHAEYSLDGKDWTVVEPKTRISDAQELDYELSLANVGPGEHTIAVRVTDEFDNQAVEKAIVR